MSDLPNELFTVMVWNDLDHIPVYPLPPGYTIRWYQPGDVAHWLAIHADDDYSAELFWREFPDEAALAERQFYVLDPDGVPVGTTTAWLNNNGFDARYGCVHWVAVHPRARRMGLAKAMLTITLQRMKALGYSRAYLRTENPIAIEMYRKFGFVITTEVNAD